VAPALGEESSRLLDGTVDDGVALRVKVAGEQLGKESRRCRSVLRHLEDSRASGSNSADKRRQRELERVVLDVSMQAIEAGSSPRRQ
jgi:hypothetical protein